MPSDTITIVGPMPSLRTEWQALYDGYSTFYKRTLTDEVADTVWGWLNDSDHELEGLIALLDNKPVGLAHFRRMPSPLRGADVGFLDDLFVSPDCRGHGVVDALFAHLSLVARERGWGVVRWITADDNYRARAVYDRLASKTSWNLYEMNP